MDPEVHRHRAHRRLTPVALRAAALTAAAVGLLAAAAGSGLRSSAEDLSPSPVAAGPCAALDALYAPRDGRAPFRPLPVLAPAGQTLSLAIRAVRPAGGVMIGDLLVQGVPVFEIMPQAGSSATVADPRTGAPVEAPGACLSSAAWAYGGTLWALTQGDRLKVHFTSDLDFKKGEFTPPIAGGVSCRAANLHTHGMLVSPYKTVGPDGKTVYGDYVLDATAPAGDAASGMGDPCASSSAGSAPMQMGAASGAMHAVVLGGLDYDTLIPGSKGRNSRLPGGHPSGLFWFHPHPHGYAGLLTTGGTTGMITVGDLQDYACVRAAGGGCAAGRIPVRDMLLKDAQVAPDHGGWRLDDDRDYELEDACQHGRAEDHPGQCTDFRGSRWLFTVNGARDPVISDVRPGQTEVWRIVNASANVAYRLRLRPAGRDGPGLPFQVLSLEGAGPDPRGAAQPGVGSELLLMPAARAEIAIAAPITGGTYVLEQQELATGGDVWPAITLAEVRFQGGAAAPSPLMLHGPESQPRAPDRFYPGPPGSCGFAADEARRIYFVKRPTFADDRRRADTFGIIATTQTANGPPTMLDASGSAVALTPGRWQALLAADPHAPAYMHNPSNGVCTYLGHTETWIIENDTDEAHNFHIHQSEFQLAIEHRGDPAYFSPLPPRRDPVLAASDQAIAAADGLGREDAEAVLFHDTIPVPRGVGLGGGGCDGSPMNPRCRPGLVTVRIRFDRDEQIGDFVYHCHILQHEDNGMMAQIRVLCPPGDSACVVRHAGAPG